MSSPSKERHTQSLARISAGEAERFLVEHANLVDNSAAVERFYKRYQHILPRWGLEPGRSATIQNKAAQGFTPDAPLPHALYTVRENLRRIWREPDVRTKDFCIQRLLHKELMSRDSRLIEPWASEIRLPEPTRFEQCLHFLERWADRTKYCGYAECSTPYFLAKRRVQKYCSEKCAGAAGKELKRHWWSKHGEEWRTAWKKARSKKKQKQR